MIDTRLKYPCKPFPYKKYPFGFHYPCQNKVEEEEVKEISKVKELDPDVVEEEPRIPGAVVEIKYRPLKRQCSFPYFRSCRPSCGHYRRNFTSKWHLQILNELEREKEKLMCISSPPGDSYEALLRIPHCITKTPVSVRLREPFNTNHCVFCDKSLYRGGAIYDLQELVPAIKKQSNDQDDDIAYRIGIRTRVVVHKSCFDKYIKANVTSLIHSNPNEDNPNNPEKKVINIVFENVSEEK